MPYGNPLNANGTFNVDFTSWLFGNGMTGAIEAQRARLTGTAINSILSQTFAPLSLGAYRIEIDIYEATTTVDVRLTGAGSSDIKYTTGPLTIGHHQRDFFLSAAAQALRVATSGGAGNVLIDNLFLRKAIPMSKVVVTLRDYDGDKKQTSAELGPVTDGPSYVTREAQAAAIRDAVNAVAGNIAQYDFLAQSTEPNNINTATPVYQTHVRWIVELFDSVTGDGPYAFDIPTADLGNAALFLDSSVEHDPAAAEWIALKAAMNGIVVNPRTGSTMTVGRIYLEE